MTEAVRFFVAGLALLAVLASDVDWAGPRHKAAHKRRPAAETYGSRPEARVLVRDLARRGLDPAFVNAAMRQAHRLEAVRIAIVQPPEQVNDWHTYRSRFVDEEHVRAGVRFWVENEASLARAARRYGVPEPVIVGILGVETTYGQNTGNYRVLDALATLAFDYPSGVKDRSGYFRAQLAEFFLWCARIRCEPLAVKGSAAGAIGIPQFVPENIGRFGVDFDGNGRIDLQNPVDAIGSVAHFLAGHGWVRGLAPCFAVDVEDARLVPLLRPDVFPRFSRRRVEAAGVKPLEPLPRRERFALVELNNGAGPSAYFLGSRNFYVLTRYNRSAYYGKAVLDLGRAVARARRHPA